MDPPPTLLGRLDRWMAQNPWHARATPFFVYMIGLLLVDLISGGAFGMPKLLVIKPALYAVQIALVVFLLVRYRKLLPELSIKFHWLALPTGLLLVFAWVYLGYATNWLSYQTKGVPLIGDAMAWLVPVDASDPLSKTDKHWINDNKESLGPLWFWTTMTLRLIGMSLVVPLFEELWVRSAVLRGTFSYSRTKTALLQLSSDLPVIGEAIGNTKAAQKAANEPPMFTRQLNEIRVGQISYFAVFASTVIFMLAHARRDYLGCIACGLVWCWLVWITNKPRKGETWADQPPGGRTGIGPIAWSHGITNAALWAWTIQTGDWQFL